MTNQTITLYEYNRKQQAKFKATEKDVTFDPECRVITRVVLGKGLTSFHVPMVLTPGLGSRLVDMLKWNIEIDAKFHKEPGKAAPEKYTQDEFVAAIWSLAAVKPLEVEVD